MSQQAHVVLYQIFFSERTFSKSFSGFQVWKIPADRTSKSKKFLDLYTLHIIHCVGFNLTVIKLIRTNMHRCLYTDTCIPLSTPPPPLMERSRWLCHFIDMLLAIDRLRAGSKKVRVQGSGWANTLLGDTHTDTHAHTHWEDISSFHLIYWSTPVFIADLWPLPGEYSYGSSQLHCLIEL